MSGTPIIEFNRAYSAIHGDRPRFTFKELDNGVVRAEISTQFGDFACEGSDKGDAHFKIIQEMHSKMLKHFDYKPATVRNAGGRTINVTGF